MCALREKKKAKGDELVKTCNILHRHGSTNEDICPPIHCTDLFQISFRRKNDLPVWSVFDLSVEIIS